MVTFCLWLSAFLQFLSTKLLALCGAERPRRTCNFCASPVCTACARSVDGSSARGEFCSPDCRAKDPEKYAPGWDDSKGGSVENADDLIKQALGLS